MKYYYLIQQDNMLPIRIAAGLTPFLLIFLFSILISSTTSNLIAFTALVISVVFIGISFWILCWILDKDPGSRAM
jgi:H+-translocating diphosphatase